MFEVGTGLPGVDGVATREQVDSRKTVFGPGMDAQVTFLYDDNARHPVGRKVVKRGVDDRCSCCSGSIDHVTFDDAHVVEEAVRTIVEFNQQVAAKMGCFRRQECSRCIPGRPRRPRWALPR